MSLTLLIVDTFGSNRLREQIGASYLVSEATSRWAYRALPVPNNLADPASSSPTFDPAARIENGTLAAEVLYAGGGNFVALFRDESSARRFVGQLSRAALCEAPGLTLAIAQRPFDWSEWLRDAIGALRVDLAAAKRRQVPTYPLLGLGVTVMCQSTGLPAIAEAPPVGEDPGYPASAETLAKLAARDAAEGRLREAFPIAAEFAFPSRTDDLGRSPGEESHVAVIHADGNGMGQRLARIGGDDRQPTRNRAYVEQVRTFSRGVTRAAMQAQQDVLDRLIEHLRQSDHDPRGRFSVANLRVIDGQRYLPFRPLVFGGDDLTVVCDGRLGLAVATSYLRAFARHTRELPGGDGPATAAAGVAIVKSHYPMARAYDLSVELCQNAKRYRRELASATGQDLATLDWHFAQGGLAGKLEDMRQREYGTADGRLTLRPVTLAANPYESVRCWPVVEAAIRAFRDEPWKDRQNKVKALRDALRQGPAAVRAFRLRFNGDRPLPDVVPTEVNLKLGGWIGDRCGYFDAVEAVDWHVPLGGSD